MNDIIYLGLFTLVASFVVTQIICASIGGWAWRLRAKTKWEKCKNKLFRYLGLSSSIILLIWSIIRLVNWGMNGWIIK